MAKDGSKTGRTRTIKASEFKAKCLKLMDEVAESSDEIVITKNGRPVSRTRALPEQAANVFWSPPRQNSNPWRHRLSDACGMV